jgi:hypothetical protein
MLPDDWHLTQDVDDFLARAGDFLRSRPALHNTPLTDIEKLRIRGAAEPEAAHERGAGTAFLADASLPSRHAHPTAAAPGGPGAPHGRAGP